MLQANEPPEKSEKSYGIAIILCGIFGILGIHHFYLGNILHGILDLAMLVLAIVFTIQGQPLLAFAMMAADLLHTIIVFYQLITEQTHDGNGRQVRLK
ncbi:MAG: NINE protein [Paracoccaceae bacterium]